MAFLKVGLVLPIDNGWLMSEPFDIFNILKDCSILCTYFNKVDQNNEESTYQSLVP